MFKNFLLLALCIAGLVMLGSCVSIATDPNSDLPANAPAAWEGQTLGVPL